MGNPRLRAVFAGDGRRSESVNPAAAQRCASVCALCYCNRSPKITPEFLRYLGFLVSEHALFLSYL